MSIEKHIPPIIEPTPLLGPILDWWLTEIQKIIGHKLKSVMLFGSVALDDFCPGWSDIDVCVILNQSISEQEGKSIGKIHDMMRDRYTRQRMSNWQSGQGIEGFYVPVEITEDESITRYCYTAGGTTRKWEIGHPISSFDRFLLAHLCHTIHGPPVSVAPPGWSALVAQANRDLIKIRQDAKFSQSCIWMCGVLHWFARSLVFWRDGRMMSKSDALLHEIKNGSKFSDAFQLALDIRQHGSAVADRYRHQLKKHLDENAFACMAEIDYPVNVKKLSIT